MKKLILSLLLVSGCATSSLSVEKVSENAKFILDVLQIDSKSLICKNSMTPNTMICTSIDSENKISLLSCDNNQCVIIKR